MKTIPAQARLSYLGDQVV